MHLGNVFMFCIVDERDYFIMKSKKIERKYFELEVVGKSDFYLNMFFFQIH